MQTEITMLKKAKEQQNPSETFANLQDNFAKQQSKHPVQQPEELPPWCTQPPQQGRISHHLPGQMALTHWCTHMKGGKRRKQNAKSLINDYDPVLSNEDKHPEISLPHQKEHMESGRL